MDKKPKPKPAPWKPQTASACRGIPAGFMNACAFFFINSQIELGPKSFHCSWLVQLSSLF